MSPLNSLINYSAELTSRSSYALSKTISSRIVNALCVPLELSAVVENAIKLPLQTTAFLIKVPAKICKVLACSTTLGEFESTLAGPTDILKTALKIVGYTIGMLFTASLGIICPYKNFRLHCAFGLTTNRQAEKKMHIAEEKKKNEIATHEKIIEKRLKEIIDAMRQQAEPVTQLTLEQREEIEAITHVPCPALEEIFEQKIENIENLPAEELKEKIQPFENLGITVESGQHEVNAS